MRDGEGGWGVGGGGFNSSVLSVLWLGSLFTSRYSATDSDPNVLRTFVVQSCEIFEPARGKHSSLRRSHPFGLLALFAALRDGK